MDLDPQSLRYFAAVADEPHFTRAAARLGVSRTVLTRAVLDLEEAIGEPLFVRPSTRTELTDAGRALHARAPEILAAAAGRVGPGTGLARPEGAGGSPAGLRVAIAPGVTVSRWSRAWAERRPDLPMSVVRTDEATQVTVLHERAADVAFVRLPVDRTGLSAIPLYSEVPVVVVDTEHLVTLMDEVSVVDLVDEHLLQDPDTVPQWRDAAATLRTVEVRPLPQMRDVADAIALVAAGLGVVVVPQSVARLHHRKDVTHRPVTDVEHSEVALAWLADGTTAAIEEFIGIVRGRSARSSRSPGPAVQEPTGTGRTAEPGPAGRTAKGATAARRDVPGRKGGGPSAPRGARRGKR